MDKTVTADGKVELSVSEHKCRANPIRPKGVPRRPRGRGISRRDSGRR